MERKKGDSIFTDYRFYLAINTLLLIVIIILLVLLIGKDDKKTEDRSQEIQNEVSEGNLEGDSPETGAETQPENKLQENTSGSVYRVVERYCDYIASGDVESLEEIVDYVPEEEKEKIRNRAAFIERFDNINCYTKRGPEENSFIVFVCYDMKLINIEVSAPDIICLYVGAKEDDGERRIHYGDIDESMQEYMAELEQDPDVQALYDDVRARYQAAQESDETLAAFIQRINGQVAEEEPQETEETPEEETPEESPQNTATAQNRQTRVTETINVRSEASTESAKLTLAFQGETITQIESYDNGWSKIEYKGVTGYVKTEYLE